MRLYKYYGFEAGIKAIEAQSYGFRCPDNFNDPFELSYLSNSRPGGGGVGDLGSALSDISKSVAILSLTRTATNPLMWAHYAEEHRGFVISYSVANDFLNSQNYNLIPVSDGDVIYTNSKNRHVLSKREMTIFKEIILSAYGSENILKNNYRDAYALAKKIFLIKHNAWSYEEEVRVVKVVDSIFEETSSYQSDPLRHYKVLTKNKDGKDCEAVPGLKIYSHPATIRSIYLGARNPILTNPNDYKEFIEHLLSLKTVAIKKMELSPTSWRLNSIGHTF